MEAKVKVHLINEQVIEYKDNCFFAHYLTDKMNSCNDTLEFDNYIVPKSSINYIEYLKIESEDNSEESI